MSLLRVRDLPSDAAASISRFVTTLDERLPGQVEAVWVEGSLVLGDYQAGLSDIDLVVMTRTPLAHHQRVRAPWPLSITWTTRGALATLHPITAATLHMAGLAVRGESPRTLVHDVPRVELIAYLRANLATYWEPWRERARRNPLFRLSCLHAGRVQWGAFGVPRQYVTAVDGTIVSKTAAARRMRNVVDARHHRILDEVLRLRTGAGRRRYRSPWARSADMLALLDDTLRVTRAALGVGVSEPGGIRQGLLTAPATTR
jgi:hypothetical protein